MAEFKRERSGRKEHALSVFSRDDRIRFRDVRDDRLRQNAEDSHGEGRRADNDDTEHQAGSAHESGDRCDHIDDGQAHKANQDQFLLVHAVRQRVDRHIAGK